MGEDSKPSDAKAEQFPPSDDQFEETTVAKVEKYEGGWSIKRADGWSFFAPCESPVEPVEGMTARFYGKGIGYVVRGLFLDGKKVFYRTEAEDQEKHEIDTYGADAADWLKRWDEGKSCWSVQMGGIGPGYEQCIQITSAEILRHLIAKNYNTAKWENEGAWKHDRAEIEEASDENETIKKLGLSGAQYGAAMNLALCLYRRGPRAALLDPAVKDRLIQVSRTFPQS